MDLVVPCPVCGSTINAKFVAGSSWCRPCSLSELNEQAIDDYVVEPEVIET